MLKDGAPANMSVVFETMSANEAQTIDVSLGVDAAACLPGNINGRLVVWSTNATVQFAGPVPVLVDLDDKGCTFSLQLLPASIVTVTTSTAGSKLGGASLVIPPSASFLGAKNYSTDFMEREPGSSAYYFSDEGGSFALAADEHNASNQVMRQMVPVHPVTGMGPAGPTWAGLNALPATVIGDVAAVNILATTSARMPKHTATRTVQHERNIRGTADEHAFEALCGRIASAQHPYDPDHGGDPPGDCLNLTSSGVWKLTQGAPIGGFGNVTKSGRLNGFNSTAWHRLELWLMATYTAGAIDGKQVFNVSSDGSAGYVGLSSSCELLSSDHALQRCASQTVCSL